MEVLTVFTYAVGEGDMTFDHTEREHGAALKETEDFAFGVVQVIARPETEISASR